MSQGQDIETSGQHNSANLESEVVRRILVAPAKLTRTLKVTGVRNDGYHLIESEMVSISLADRIEISEGSGLEIRYAPGGFGPMRGRIGMEVVSGGDNLVSRALSLAGRDARVRLTKLIPAGAGLGGGSSDAAAILRWAGVFDAEIAAKLGADVPFCLKGGRAVVRGIGEEVDRLEEIALDFVLLVPPFGVETKSVYRAWDELGGRSDSALNDLTIPALHVEPRMIEWRDVLGNLTGTEPTMAGSGSTWFVEASPDDVGLGEGRLQERAEELLGKGALLFHAHAVPAVG